MAEQSRITIERRGDWHPALTDPSNRFYGTAVAWQMGSESMDLLLDGHGFRLGLSDEQIIGYTLLIEAGLYPSADNDLVIEATELGFTYLGEEVDLP